MGAGLPRLGLAPISLYTATPLSILAASRAVQLPSDVNRAPRTTTASRSAIICTFACFWSRALSLTRRRAPLEVLDSTHARNQLMELTHLKVSGDSQGKGHYANQSNHHHNSRPCERWSLFLVSSLRISIAHQWPATKRRGSSRWLLSPLVSLCPSINPSTCKQASKQAGSQAANQCIILCLLTLSPSSRASSSR